jgi:hypothetical protein
MIWKPHGGRKVIIAPDGSDASAPANLRLDETLIRALARQHRWRRLLDGGTTAPPASWLKQRASLAASSTDYFG